MLTKDANCATATPTFANVKGTSQTLATIADGTDHLCVTTKDDAGNRRAIAAGGPAQGRTVPQLLRRWLDLLPVTVIRLR